MTSAARIIDCLDKLLTVTQVTKKKEYLNKLREIVDDDSCQLALNQASGRGRHMQDGSLSWQKVFSTLHRFYVDECLETAAKDSTSKANLRDEACKLFALTVNYANKDRDLPYLEYSATAEVFMDTARNASYGAQSRDLYINLLHDKLVSLSGYWNELSTEQWNELVDFSIEMFENVSNTVKCKLMQILEICIRVGSGQSLVILNLKNKFNFFEKIPSFAGESVSTHHYAELLLKLNISLSKELAMDCRFALCKLGESIIPPIEKLLRREMELFFKYCIFQVVLHHPGGAEKGSGEAYAHDWDKWSSILLSVFHRVQNELRMCIENTKGRNKRNQEPSVPPDLIYLAVEIYRQIFSMDPEMLSRTQNTTLNDSLEGPTLKRARMEIGMQGVIDQLKCAKRSEDICIRLIILAAFLKKYGATLPGHEYLNVLQTLAETRSLSRTSLVMSYLCQCFESLLKSAPKLEKLAEKESEKVLWLKIWDMALRSAGLNQCIMDSNNLLQALLESPTGQSVNVNHIFDLFVQKTINLNAHSLQTLNVLIKTRHLPLLEKYVDLNVASQGTANMIANWQLILSWLLPNGDDDDEGSSREVLLKIPAHLIGEVAIRLICKNRIALNDFGRPAYHRESPIDLVQKIHDTYGPKTDTPGAPLQSSYKTKLQFYPNGLETLSTLLLNQSNENHEQLVANLTQTQQNASYVSALTFGLLVHQIMVNATVLSHLVETKLVDEESILNFALAQQTCQLLEAKVPTALQKFIETNPYSTTEVLLLEELYAANHHKVVLNLIRNSTPQVFLKKIRACCSADRAQGRSYESSLQTFVETSLLCAYSEIGQLTREEIKQITWTKVNAAFCFHPNMPMRDQVLEHSTDVLRVVYDLIPEASPAELQQILLTLKAASRAAAHFNEDHANFIMESLKNLVIKNKRNLGVLLALLDILEGVLVYLHTSNHATHKGTAQAVVRGCKIMCDKQKKFGAQMRLALINCMSKWIQIDPEQGWAVILNSPVALELINFAGEQYQEVRVAMVASLHQIFKPSVSTWTFEKKADWRKTALKKLVEVVRNLLANLEQTETGKDDQHNLGVSALMSLSEAMIHCPEQRKKTLHTMFEVVKNLSVDGPIVKSHLNYIGQTLNCDFNVFLRANLRSLLVDWCTNHPIAEFPFTLLGCSTRREFYSEHLNEVVVTLMLLGKKDELAGVAGELAKSSKDLILNCKVAIFSVCIPQIACKEQLEAKTQAKLKICHTLFAQYMDPDDMAAIMGENIVEVVCSIYACLYETDHWEQVHKENFVMARPDHTLLNRETLGSIMLWIQQQLGQPDTSVIGYLANEHPEHCQMILQKTTLRVIDAATQEMKLLFFLQYTSLVEELANLVKIDKLGEISHFVVNYMVNVHLGLLTEDSTSLLSAVCTSLALLITSCCKKRSEILQPLVPKIVNCLVSVIKCHPDSTASIKALAILEYIIVKKGTVFSEAIGFLEQFPHMDEFKKVQDTLDRLCENKDNHLESDIERFLAAGAHGNRIEGLQKLRCQLVSKKQQLAILYSELQGVQELASNSNNLHLLITSLLNLMKSADLEIALEAASCLGELGPGELFTAVLVEKESEITDKANPVIQLCARKIKLLQDYLTDTNSEVCVLAADSLHTLLHMKAGRKALDEFPDSKNLYPFRRGNATSNINVQVNDVKLLSTMDNSELWCPRAHSSHTTWVTNLTCGILKSVTFDKAYSDKLVRLCELKTEFSELILPPLILLVLSNEDCAGFVLDKLKDFFECHFRVRDKAPSKVGRYIFGNKKSVQCMLDVVQFLRTYTQGDALQHLNLLHVAQAAQFCSAHFSCIFYSELHGLSKKFASAGRMRSIEEICDDTEVGRALHRNLFNSYKSIGEADAIYGCGMTRLLDSDSQERYLQHTGQWERVLLLQDVDSADADGTAMMQRMAPAMMNLGLQNLLRTHLEGSTDDGMLDAQLQCCWRLGQWDQPTILELGQQETSFESSRYSALKSLVVRDDQGLEQCLKLAKKSVIDALVHSNLESMQTVYAALARLQMTQEINDADQLTLEELLDKWHLQDAKAHCEFKLFEEILAQRLCILTHSKSTEDREQLQSAAAHLLLKMSELARQNNCLHVSSRALAVLSDMKSDSKELHYKTLLEKANSHWAQGDAMFGKQILATVIAELKAKETSKTRQQPTLSIQAVAMRTYGTWLVETGIENSHVIIEEYLMPAAEIFKNNEGDQDMSEKVETFRTLASFADTEYQRVLKYINSPNFKAKVAHMEEVASKVAAFKQGKGDKDLYVAFQVNKIQNINDKGEIDAVNKEKQQHLEMALCYYVECLKLSDERISTVFRVISLLLENRSSVVDLKSIASYKFIPVIPQLTPHLRDSTDDFQKQIGTLLTRLAKDHPHHTLPHLLALKFAALDHKFEKTVKLPSNEARITAAANLVKRLASQEGSLPQIIKQMEDLTKAVVQLAYYTDQNAKQMSSSTIPKKLDITKLSNFDKIQVSTSSLPVQKSGEYKPNGIRSYENKFTLVGGIHAPKKIECTSLNGVKHIQLCKGLDDLHLDAVMQQVFTIVNSMLQRSGNSSSRKLRLRTYNVCPLSQRSGLIEWCQKTIPIGTYLLQCHPKYGPTEMQPSKCRSTMKECEDNHFLNKEKRISVFKKICSNFRPVFHNFFLEFFPMPAEWFVRRLAYTRSVATSSMIGYILGLGDRHVQNILIDTTTAEVIHIDYGICFEQALVLRIPELVPFRLSRDIEAGFGISGTEGVFKKSCEVALQVLRDNQTTIQSILQVLLYNPMYVWSIPISQNQNDRSKVRGEQNSNYSGSDEANLLAERALLRLQQKLMGTEEGMANSVEGQVNRLIQKARDPQNLALMFSGWQPYL